MAGLRITRVPLVALLVAFTAVVSHGEPSDATNRAALLARAVPEGYSVRPEASLFAGSNAAQAVPWFESAPRLVYDLSGFEDRGAGFPNLVLYDDGVALLGVRGRAGPPEKANVFDGNPQDVVTLMKGLQGVGLFDVKQTILATNGYDLPGIYIEARRGDRRVAVYAYGHSTTGDFKVVVEASALIQEFIGGLVGGRPYNPRGYELQVMAAGDGEQPPADADDGEEWTLSTVPLLALTLGERDLLALAPSYRAGLLRIGPAYTWVLVKSHPYYYRVRWRPLYPHE